MPETAGFIRALRLKRDEVPGFDRYPFAIPAVCHAARRSGLEPAD
jgi:hypothetical protein